MLWQCLSDRATQVTEEIASTPVVVDTLAEIDVSEETIMNLASRLGWQDSWDPDARRSPGQASRSQAVDKTESRSSQAVAAPVAAQASQRASKKLKAEEPAISDEQVRRIQIARAAAVAKKDVRLKKSGVAASVDELRSATVTVALVANGSGSHVEASSALETTRWPEASSHTAMDNEMDMDKQTQQPEEPGSRRMAPDYIIQQFSTRR